MLSGNEIWIVLLVVAVIFGASRLPLLGRNLGQGIKEFRKGIGEAKADKQREKEQRERTQLGDPPVQSQDGTPPDGRITDRSD
jgi:sec-independent protein translocase protein TatA